MSGGPYVRLPVPGPDEIRGSESIASWLLALMAIKRVYMCIVTFDPFLITNLST